MFSYTIIQPLRPSSPLSLTKLSKKCQSFDIDWLVEADIDVHVVLYGHSVLLGLISLSGCSSRISGVLID